MAGFIRRYGFFPGTEVITQIEGVVIVDLPPPGAVDGVGTGVTLAIGEFADMTYAITHDSAGVISTDVRPVEVFTTTDLLLKGGGFDETLGEFGVAQGNAFASLRNKRFTRLVIAPVNLCSAQGARFFRQLPLNAGSTDANPVVPVQGATISAGREFRIGAARFKIGQRMEFSSRAPIETGVGGSTSAGASAATQTFNRAAGDWTLVDRGDGTLGAREGDILVVGYNNGGALSTDAGTYRVQTTPGSGTAIVLERLDGANFAWTGEAGTVSWRLHFSTDADTAPERVIGSASPGGYAFGDDGGYIVGLRPITDASGAQTDGSHTAGGLLTPAVVPTALTGSSANALSGLGGALHPTTATVFDVELQGINASNDAVLDAAYATAIDSTISEDAPSRDVNIVVASRKSSNIRTKLKSHVLAASEVGLGRMAVVAPELDELVLSTIIGDSDPGVGANRDERVVYSWPGAVHFVPEAVNFLLGTADGDFTSDGQLDDSFDFWMASILSNLPPERNPGQAAEPVPSVLSPVLGFQRGVSGLGITEYTALRRAGVAALRLDRTVGPIVQSGITSSLVSGEKNIKRRRMADFIEDSLAQRLVSFSKDLQSQERKDAAVGEVDAFLNELLSPNNPKAQRIAAYQVDDKSGNTPDLEAKGIFVIIVRVRTLATSDFIVLQAEIGDGVVITSLAA